jgi:hypothetical protein
MTERDPFEARFAAAYADYLDGAPTEVDAAEVARTIARAQPRIRAGARFALPGLTPRLAWLLLLAALLAAFGAGALVVGSWPARMSEVAPPAAPTVAPSTAPAPSVPAVLAPVPSAPAAAFTVADLVGTWTGTVIVPGFDEQGMALDPSKDTSFTTTVTLGDCTAGASCGSFSFATPDWAGTGKAMSCEGTLKYRGPYEDRPAFAFEEAITSRSGAIAAMGQSQAPKCSWSMTLVITPLSSGGSAGVEEKGDAWEDYGVLVKSATP